MIKLFQEIGRAGDATIAYPAGAVDFPDGYRGKPEHNEVMCIACAACAIACPPNAITMSLDENEDNIIWNISYGRCIFCGRCHEVCPVDAIELTQEFELAVMSKSDLTNECAYPIARCSRCGKPYASAKEIEHSKQLLASMGYEQDKINVPDVCIECRRIEDARNAKKIALEKEGRVI